MAISTAKKTDLVAELNELLASAKMAVFANYTGLTVAETQELRRAARAAGVKIKVVKNRLVRVAMKQNDGLKDLDSSSLKGQVLYAFSDEDEVVPAKVLADFAKTHPAMKLMGAFNADGVMSDAEAEVFANLPTKNELIAQVVATLQSPLDGILSGINGLGSLLNAVEASK
jgi:large subunit ribosomal protein L10